MLEWQISAILFGASSCHDKEAGRWLEVEGGFCCFGVPV